VNAANKTPGACPECGNINPEKIFSIIETRVVNEFGRFTHTRKISPGQWYQYFKKQIKIPRVEPSADDIPSSLQLPNWLKQFSVFVKRDVLSKISNKQYLTINFTIAPILALFISYFVKYYDAVGVENPHYTFFHNNNIPVYFFMSVVVALFVGLIVSAEEIFHDRKILKRERYLHLSKSGYLISKVFILFTVSAIQTISFIIVGNWILEIPITEIRYWWILFSCSCFANILGLNISSAFDSAVTIYILIPILIIPQLLLSGVVISFDKFNPNVGTPNGIPLLGELMTSRWAFEAYMVTQFKDNPLESIFYETDKKEAISEYKRVYYIPSLESKLAFVLNHRSQWRDRSDRNPVKETLHLLQTELRHELADVGRENFPEIDNLVIGKFDSATYQGTVQFVKKLKAYYQLRGKNALVEHEALVASMTDTPEKLEAFNESIMKYRNERVTQMVENSDDPVRILEWDGQFIQKIYPIYFDDHR
ncbi:MAG: ABC transporter permease, partial [Cyclobacteriaceae bacterium]